MKLPRTLSLRAELLIALAMFVVVNAITAIVQPQVEMNGGKGWDGAAYFTVAEQLALRQPLAAEAPFVYRVGTPVLATLVDRGDLISAFRNVNIAANLALTLLLVVFLRLYVRDWRVRLSLVGAFLLQWHGPVRFTHFYPVVADNLFVAALLGGLVLLHYARYRLSWLLIVALGAVAFGGTLVRESGLLLALVAPFARNPVQRKLEFARLPVGLVVPLVLAIAGFLFVHSIGHATNVVSRPEAGGLIVPKSPPAYLLGWWTAFGPLLILPLFTWRRSLAFLWQHQHLGALLLALTLLSSFQSPALQLQLDDTARYLFWVMPIVYVLIGRAIEQLGPLLSRPLIAVLVVSQVLAERALWTIPQPGRDPASALERGTASVLLFTPLGSDVRYVDIFPSLMAQSARLVLLGEFVLLAAVIVGWLWWSSRRAVSQQRATLAASAA
jgi:hypothetical protein